MVENTMQPFNLRDGVVVQDYGNPNEVYMKLYGKPAPYVGAGGTAEQIFANTGINPEQGRGYALGHDILQAAEHTKDVIAANNQNSKGASNVTLSSVMSAQGGLKLPGSGVKVNMDQIKDAIKIYTPVSPGLAAKAQEAIDYSYSQKVKQIVEPETSITGPLSIDKYGRWELTSVPGLIESSGSPGSPLPKMETLTKYGYTSDKDNVYDITGKLVAKRDAWGNVIPLSIGSFGSSKQKPRPTPQHRSASSGFMGIFKEVKQAIPKKPMVKKSVSIPKSNIPKSILKSKPVSVLGVITNTPNKKQPVKKTPISKKPYSAWEDIMGRK